LPHGDVCLLLSVAEEIGLLGAAAMDLERLGLDFGYVLDTSPPVGSFVTRAGTHDSFKAIIRGKPAHAGKEPEKGINAISVAAEAINGMRLGRIAEETTANIGSIHGGSAANVVCPEVKVIAEARSTDVAVLDAQVGHMVQRFEEAAAKFGATVEIDHGRHYVGYTIEPDAPVLRVAREAAASLGLSGKTRTTLGGSDANVFNAKGLSCVVLATGMDKIHTHDEHISRSDLVLTARLSLAILLGVAK
jgi:tripeptide aminopeptidase